MRLHKHIDEAVSGEQSLDFFTIIVKKVVKDCSPYLKELVTKGKFPYFLLSGRKKDTPMFDAAVRMNRLPTDTNPEISMDFDDAFLKQFGWKARSQSLFCTGSESDTMEYGHPYLIFPMGKYRFLWHKEVGDLYMYLSQHVQGTVSKQVNNNQLLMSHVRGGAESLYPSKLLSKFFTYYNETRKEGGENGVYVYDDMVLPKGFKYRVGAVKYVESQLPDTEEYNGSKLIWFPDVSYSVFQRTHFDDWKEEYISKALEDARPRYEEGIKDFVKEYKMTNLKAAIDSNNEVMLNCKRYVAVSGKDRHGYLLSRYLQKFGYKGHTTQEELKDWWIKEGYTL